MGDIEGITKTECNLGIAYAELGHLKLAGAWFTQVHLVYLLYKCTSVG